MSMHKTSITVGELFRDLEEPLDLKLIAGESGLERSLAAEDLDPNSFIIAGPLNFIHPNYIQVIGRAERDYLQAPERDMERAMTQLFQPPTRAVILTDGISPNDDLLQGAADSGIALFTSSITARVALDHLQHYASLNLSDRTTLHGVFLEVLGMGVLITGEAAVGKSELALELITNGSRLIADDAPEFTRIAPEIVSGRCPELLRDLLEVRGLGVLNIRAMFGANAIKQNKFLRLIVHLKRMNENEIKSMPRLEMSQDTREVLGVEIAQVTLPVAAGRNLGVLVEAAVRNHLLKLEGNDATQLLIERQEANMRQSDD